MTYVAPGGDDLICWCICQGEGWGYQSYVNLIQLWIVLIFKLHLFEHSPTCMFHMCHCKKTRPTLIKYAYIYIVIFSRLIILKKVNNRQNNWSSSICPIIMQKLCGSWKLVSDSGSNCSLLWYVDSLIGILFQPFCYRPLSFKPMNTMQFEQIGLLWNFVKIWLVTLWSLG